MKTLFKHISAYFLILLVLGSSANISLNKMKCLLTGKVVYSLEELEDCSPQKEGDSFTQRCCDFYNATLDFEYQTVVKQITFGVDLVDLPVVISFVSELEKPLFTSLINFYSNSSPPLSGYSLLKSIQVFRL
ncbi:MAG: hypothetical protein KF732_09545 [Flavobacteriales bacterium]|jgi:hypothetical protein|nr:hypothetical protein [Flavobacteriales bacterium]MBX2960187.1 hypothetical protein [Flavobacteriales bacterium]MCL4856765.1 hypothetical protein [Flavobacteriales bacterium]HRN42465.1 hypothetical protein [Vicingus sp.]HRP59563.1 hypothetical protein [Vicingus sp.]